MLLYVYTRFVLYTFRLDFSRLSARGRTRVLWAAVKNIAGPKRKLSRVARLSIYSKYKFTQLTQFERTPRVASRSSSSTSSWKYGFIVVGSSIKVPTKFASRVTILSSLPSSISLFLFLDTSFSRRGRESSGTCYRGVNQCDSILSTFFLASSPFHLRSELPPFFCLTSTSPSSPVSIPPLASRSFFPFIYTLRR